MEGRMNASLLTPEKVRDWLLPVISRKLEVPEEHLPLLLNQKGKLDKIIDFLPDDKLSHKLGYVLLEDSLDAILPVMPEGMVSSLSKYWQVGIEENEQIKSMKASVEQYYRKLIGEFPVFEKAFLGFGLLNKKENPFVYLKMYCTQNYLPEMVVDGKKLLVNYLLMPTRSLESFNIFRYFPPLTMSYSSYMVAAAVLWLVWPQGFKDIFGVNTPFDIENTDMLVSGFKKINGEVGLNKEEETPYDRIANSLAFRFKQDASGKFVRSFYTAFHYILFAVVYGATSAWTGTMTVEEGKEVEVVEKNKVNVIRKIKQAFFLRGVWEHLYYFVENILKTDIGNNEKQLIAGVLNAVRHNSYGMMKHILSKYALKDRMGHGAQILSEKKKDTIVYFLKQATLSDYIAEIARYRENLGDIDSLRCFFGLDNSASFGRALSDGLIPPEWRNKTIPEIIADAFENYSYNKVSEATRKAFKNRSGVPRSLGNFNSIMMLVGSSYRIRGKEETVKRLINLFETLYPPSYPYRGLRAFTIVMLIALMVKNPEKFLPRVKCVGRKFTTKLVDLFASFLS